MTQMKTKFDNFMNSYERNLCFDHKKLFFPLHNICFSCILVVKGLIKMMGELYMKPLEGYTVIDLTTYVAAPVCARILSDLGARVIKIESPKGDGWRRTGVDLAPKVFTPEVNTIFDLYNSGKEMISLNLKSEEGMAIMHQLLAKADIFITNNRPAALERLGLHYDQLKEKYPKLIYGIVLGFGEKGPDAQKRAFDTTAFWARSGFLRDCAVHGELEYTPVDTPASVGDSYTGTNLAMQVLAAILARQTTGKGQCIKVSLYHIGAFAMATMVARTQRPNGVQMPMNRWDSKPTTGSFRCADGEYIFLSLAPNRLFELVGTPEKIQDPIWDVKNLNDTRKERYTAISQLMLTKTVDQWMELFKNEDTPTVRLAHFADIAEDEQAWANDFVEKVEYPNGQTNVVPTIPISLEGIAPVKLQTTRRIGQDTAKVLEDLGYTPEQMEQLAATGIIIK